MAENYSLHNCKPFCVDAIIAKSFISKLRALKILVLNKYITSSRKEKFKNLTAEDFNKSLRRWISTCDEEIVENQIAKIQTKLLMIASDYYVSEVFMKKELLRVKKKNEDEYKKYTRAKNKLLNLSGVTIISGKEGIKLDKEKEFKLHKLNVTAGTENYSFHISLFKSVKKLKELTEYSFMNIFILISYTFEYFKIHQSKTSVVKYADSIRNRFYRLKNQKEKVIQILRMESELYEMDLAPDKQEVSKLLDWFDSELD